MFARLDDDIGDDVGGIAARLLVENVNVVAPGPVIQVVVDGTNVVYTASNTSCR